MAHVEQWVSCTDTHGVEVHGDYAGTVQLEGRTKSRWVELADKLVSLGEGEGE